MKFNTLLTLGSLACSAAARSMAHVGKRDADFPRPHMTLPNRAMSPKPEVKRDGKTIIPITDKNKKYIVNGTSIPEVDFDIGESYAGNMPLGPKNANDSFYFWFFPSENPQAKEEVVIWLNGGPGCSSLEGLLQENGPFIWQYGTLKPTKNYWTWVNLTNVVWVEQPLGTGFSQGNATATDEKQVAEQFLGFWKNFVDSFGLHGKKVYITGESYAGYYVPNIASAMLDKKDKKYFNLEGTMAYDPVVSYDVIGNDIPALPFAEHHSSLFNLNATFKADLYKRAKSCGYTDFFNDYLTFPPKGPFPTPKNNGKPVEGCEIWNDIFNAVLITNPCFDVYQVATTCPLLYDVLGFPGSIPYLPEGAEVYFDRADVKKAMNAPDKKWDECADGVLTTENSPPSFFDVYPGVIERSKRTLIVHGNLDYVLVGNGTLLGIQNMTWGGKQGFQKAPKEDFYVPYHPEASLETLASSGIMGKSRTERGLTWIEQYLSGHMVPQYAPSSSYRQLEFLLGRIKSVADVGDFTTLPGEWGNKKPDYGNHARSVYAESL